MSQKYVAKYVRTSIVKELLIEGDTKIRIAGEAKEKVAEYLDQAVMKAVKELINKLPRKSKGDSKGELSRITLQLADFGGKEEKKAEPKKAEPKKEEPKKAEPKKEEPKKPEPPKAEEKKD
jgi:neurofilament heavy polypeptide